MTLRVALAREFLLLWRHRSQFLSIFVFGAVALLLFSFAVGPDAGALRRNAAGFLWLAVMLSSTLSLTESFHLEVEQRALEGLLLLPVSERVFFYGKALANAIQLAVLGIALVPMMIVLYDVVVVRPLALALVIALGSAGIAAPGTVYAAIAAGARSKQTLLPLLLFPLVVPVLLAAVKATSLLLTGDPMEQLRSWIGLLVVFNAVYWPLSGLLAGRVLED